MPPLQLRGSCIGALRENADEQPAPSHSTGGALRTLGAVAIAVVVAITPTALAVVDVEDPGAPGSGGPCYEEPCAELPPPDQDPLPLGEDVTKISAGGTCREGSYAVACETDDCLGTFWVFGACSGTSTCAAFLRTTCVGGANQEKAVRFANEIARRFAGATPIPDTHVTPPGIAIGGNCADHDVALSCNYHVGATDECISLPGDPTDPFAPVDCHSETMHCSVYATAAGGCQEARVIYNYEGVCQLALSLCTPVCRELREFSITTC